MRSLETIATPIVCSFQKVTLVVFGDLKGWVSQAQHEVRLGAGLGYLPHALYG
jgi:hypothetical protein